MCYYKKNTEHNNEYEFKLTTDYVVHLPAIIAIIGLFVLEIRHILKEN